MDDAHRQPSREDRARLVDRIKAAADQGWINAADRDIRVANVGSATSMGELDLVGRDLDQLQATFAATTPGDDSAPAQVYYPATPTPMTSVPETAGGSAVRSLGVVIAAIVAVVVVGAGAAMLVLVGTSGGSGSSSSNSPEGSGPVIEDPLGEGPSGPQDPDVEQQPVRISYDLTERGIKAFLQAYRARFHTSQVVDLTMYDTATDDYVVVNVPVKGGNGRQQGWILRDSKWSEFGSTRARIPGTKAVDTRQLDIRRLMRNISTARTTLEVEDVSTTYVIVRWFSTFEDRPSVDIHVSNKFSESGYLATFLDGTVERAYAFGN